MTRGAWVRSLACLTALAPAVLATGAGCQSIVGIEDRVYRANAGSGGGSGAGGGGGGSGAPVVSPECESYCADVMTNCTDEFQVYGSIETCQGVCALLDAGDPLEPAGNTRACRANQAELAGLTNEPEVHCPRASPTGGEFCGGVCESYCQLLDRGCSKSFAGCEDKCPAFARPGEYSSSILEGDSLWCRVSHVAAASSAPEMHCDHAGVLPSGFCVDPDDAPVSCEDYCRVAAVACVGAQAVYESDEQCLAACAALPVGTTADRRDNTVGCRKYHAYASIADPATHCPHAGPSGGAFCGDPETGECLSYCTLAEAACPTDFANAFDSEAACLADCGALGASPARYSVAGAESGADVNCRVLHATRALGNPAECAAVFGGAPCVD